MWGVPSSPPLPGAGRGGSSSSGAIREGFLCPLCLKDLQSVQQLQAHYEDAHSGEDDGHMVGQIKTLFGRAKRKLLKREDTERSDTERSDFLYSGGVDTSKWEDQDLGATRNVRSEFQRWRGARIDHYVIEVNKLLIRLEKLTAFDRASTDPAKRKALERSVVTWVSDRDVPCCPDCGVTFAITLRRHHCRLCGSIMCRRCTQFLTMPFVHKLTSAVRASVAAGGSPCGPDRMAGSAESGRRLSVSSISSLLEEKDDDRILSCQHCKGILEQRERRLEEQGSSPIIAQLYQKLRSCIERVEKLAPEYLRMAESLNAGESTYGLERASNLRVELMKLYERIDLLSKKIAALGLTEDPQPHPKTLQLQRMIRLSATHFLQEKLMGLTSLPTLEKFEELKERRKQREAEAFAETQSRDTGTSPPTIRQRPSRMTIDRDSGWLASSSAATRGQAAQLDDPLLEQIANIKSFLAQARAAERDSEARTLEENLRQLEAELAARAKRENGGPGPGAEGWAHPRLPPTAEPPQGPSVNGTTWRDRGLNPFEEEAGEAEAANPFEEEGAHGAPANPFEDEEDERALEVSIIPFKGQEGEERAPGAPTNPFEGQEGDEGAPWAPTNPFECEEEREIEEELLRQQIDNIKAYAFDAKLAGRMDEVASLMDNLGELRQALEGQRSRRQAL